MWQFMTYANSLRRKKNERLQSLSDSNQEIHRQDDRNRKHQGFRTEGIQGMGNTGTCATPVHLLHGLLRTCSEGLKTPALRP